MKRALFILTLILLGITSCEKPVSKGEAGNPLIKFFGDAYGDKGISIAETDDGYVICGKLTILERSVNDAGQTYIETSDEDFGIISLDKMGNQKWSLNLGDSGFDEARKIIVTSDGSYVCAGTGTFTDLFGVHRDVYIAKISSAGVVIWESRNGDPGNQEANDVIETADGDYIITGSTDISGDQDILFMKFSASGNYDRANEYGAGEFNDIGKRILLKGEGEYLVMGVTGQSDPGQIGTNLILLTINESLNDYDPKIFGSESVEVGTDLLLIDGGYLITGNRIATDGTSTGFIIRLSSTGYLEQPYTIKLLQSGGSPLEINSITSVGDGVYMVAGSTGTAQSGDMIFMFIDADGNEVISPNKFISGGTGFQSVCDAIFDSNGKVVAIGVNSYETNSLITFLKFDLWGE
jgi:hypothetical protein